MMDIDEQWPDNTANCHQFSDADINHNGTSTTAPEDAYFAALPAKSFLPREIRDIGIILDSRRRAAFQQSVRGSGTSWHDADDSGTYHPKADRATPPSASSPHTKRVRLAAKMDVNGDPIPQNARPRKRVGYRSLVKLVLESEKGLEYLRSITPGPYDLQSSRAVDEVSGTGLGRENETGHRSYPGRRRTKPTRRLRDASERYDGLTLDQLTVGHPQRRGCKACFEIGDDECSLIDQGFLYPCTACDDAGSDCELIVPPKWKKSCERCKSKRLGCSYVNDGGRDSEACQACQEAGMKCFAGPLRYWRRFNSGFSQTTKTNQNISSLAEPRKYVACIECRNSDLKCSLKRNENGPCKACRLNEGECNFEFVQPPLPIPYSRASKNAASSPESATKVLNGEPRSSTRRNEAFNGHAAHKATIQSRTVPSHSGKVGKQEKAAEAQKHSNQRNPPHFISGPRFISITTFFCHPITFNHIPDPRGTSPCSFCFSPFFGLLGHGEVTVEVLVPDHSSLTKTGISLINNTTSHSTSGYEEISGGHAERGEEYTKMCISCTFSRLRIIACESHVISPIQNLDPRIFDSGEMSRSFMALASGGKGDGDGGAEELALKTKWCSICLSVAESACCARQEFDAGGELVGESNEDGEADSEGCGLQFCGACEDLFRKVSMGGASGYQAAGMAAENSLDRVIRIAGNDKWNYRDGIRADAGFLTWTGELMVRMLAQQELEEQQLELERREKEKAKQERKRFRVGRSLNMGIEKKKKKKK